MNKFVGGLKKSVTAKVAAVGAGIMAFAGHVSAAGIDTSGITSALTDAGAAVAVVGGAVVVAYVGVKVFKMVRAAL